MNFDPVDLNPMKDGQTTPLGQGFLAGQQERPLARSLPVPTAPMNPCGRRMESLRL